MERAERLLDLVTLLLNADRPVAFREIREHFEDYAGVAHESALRKFERDKADLLDLGIPLTYAEPDPDGEDEGGYQVPRDAYFLPRLDLEPQQLALLYVAGAAAHDMEGFPWPAEVARALEKIAFAAEESGSTPAPLMRRLAVYTRPRGDGARVGRWFEALRDALSRQKTVQLTYHGLYRDEVTRREVEPYGLFLREGTWCLYAHCRLRKGRRTFHLDRIVDLEVNSRRPKSADYELPGDVDLAALARQRPWEYPIERPVEVSIRLEPHLAFSAHTLFGESARVTPRPDGRADVEVVARHLDSLVRHVLSLRDGAEIRSPPEVRADAVKRLEAAAEARR